MRVSSQLLVLILMLLPATATSQETASLAFRSNDATIRLSAPTATAWAGESRQDTLATPKGVRNSPVVWGAVIGGLVGGTAMAVHTLSDNEAKPADWVVAAAAPLVGGLVGAGIGLVFR